MAISFKDQLRDFLSAGRLKDAILLLENVSLPTALELFAGLPDEQQQVLFRNLAVGLAAKLLKPFPYYHQYILLHTRPADEIHQVLDHMDPDERMQFLDELPEEAWQHLVEGTLERAAEPPAQKKSAPVVEVKRPVVPEIERGEPIIEARSIEKYFVQPDGERVQIIAPLDLSIFPGTIVALLGASGCGKSTLLRILSGLAKPSSGQVLWDGHPLSEVLPNVAIVFQSFALFPWLSVLENVEAPLLARGVEEPERRARASEAISTVGLQGFETAYPKELPGGMRQRVGFARALVVQPEVLFMDEPFSALDVLTAESLRGELLELWQNQKMPTRAIFLVTHNIEEAVLLADRIVVLGKNPAQIRADFEIDIPQYRDRKSPRFLAYVDYIYKALTKPTDDLAAPTSAVARAGNGR